MAGIKTGMAFHNQYGKTLMSNEILILQQTNITALKLFFFLTVQTHASSTAFETSPSLVY